MYGQHLVDIHGQARLIPHNEIWEIIQRLISQCPPCGPGHTTPVQRRNRTLRNLFVIGADENLLFAETSGSPAGIRLQVQIQWYTMSVKNKMLTTYDSSVPHLSRQDSPSLHRRPRPWRYTTDPALSRFHIGTDHLDSPSHSLQWQKEIVCE